MKTNELTGLVLAGGAGRRVGGHDKGLLQWQGAPLVEHVISRFSPQVSKLLISCNRNRQAYASYSPHLIPDAREDYAGPLAGIEAAAAYIETDILIVAPCDLPKLPLDLASRLTAALHARASSGISIVFAEDSQRGHYLCAAIHRECLSTLTEFLDKGGRAVHEWYRQQGAEAVDFRGQEAAFVNFNQLPEQP